MPQSSSAERAAGPVSSRLARWPAFPYDVTTRISLWLSVLVAAALFGWGAWQRRWIADDGLIVLRTVRNLIGRQRPRVQRGGAGRGEHVDAVDVSDVSRRCGRRPGAARVRGPGARPGAQRGRCRVPDARRRAAVRTEPAGASGIATSSGRAGLHCGAARPRLRHLGTRKRFGAGLSRPAVVDDGLLVAGVARATRR